MSQREPFVCPVCFHPHIDPCDEMECESCGCLGPSSYVEDWPRLRALVERVAERYDQEMGHDLCPWGFDATELPGALDYIDTVIRYLAMGGIEPYYGTTPKPGE